MEACISAKPSFALCTSAVTPLTPFGKDVPEPATFALSAAAPTALGLLASARRNPR